jgi:hypothetical protein
VSLRRSAARILVAAAIALGLCACSMSFGPGSTPDSRKMVYDPKQVYDPNPPGSGMGGWYDGTGPRGSSGGH